jgi:hypothetical protein
MVDINEVKNRIINFLKAKGPGLPVQISKEMRMDTIIISALLGELLTEKRIKTSNLRVGGTSLYLIPGEEPKLESFHNFLHPKEQEAYRLLKGSKILKDSDQEPAIRVALRNIKDFAISFKMDENIYWRYLTVTENEIREILEPKSNIQKEESKPEIKIEIKEDIKPEIKQETNLETKSEETKPEIKEIIKPIEIKEESKSIETKPVEIKTEIKQEKPVEKPIEIQKIKKIKDKPVEIKPTTEFTNPLAIKIEPKPEKIKPKSDFILKVIRSLEKSGFKILEEKEFNKNTYNCIAELNTELGPIAFLTQAKDKKSIADSDLDKLLREAQSIPLPALMLTPGGLSKKALEYQQKYYSILKVKRI